MKTIERLLLDEKLEQLGCSDGACIVFKRGGQHTNGGCKCSTDRIKMTRVIRAYADYVG